MEICPPSLCTGCGACVNSCPKGCISWRKDELDTLYPAIDESSCISCGSCQRACPNNTPPVFYRPRKAYAAWSLNAEERRTSASGGISSVFYRYAISRKGFTCGVAFELQHGAHYTVLETPEDIPKVKNSKYVYSHTDDIYRKVREALRQERFVFFIGLPCQVAGLKSYLGSLSDSDWLLSADILCHGVCNEDYLFQFVDYIESVKKRKVQFLQFRDPEYGTHGYIFTLREKRTPKDSAEASDKGKVFYRQNHYGTNLYYIGYMDELHYRENCYNCRYARLERVSDLTFGDFDRLGEDIPFAHWNKQVSLCLVNTPKGEVHLAQVTDQLFLEERPIEEAVKPQKQLNAPAKGHPKRQLFLDEYKKTHNYVSSARKALQPTLRRNLLRRFFRTPFVSLLHRLTTEKQRRHIRQLISR